ncbi:glycoside hydrolase family 10 protein [Epilithonimonas pallida]|uniref:glycoside hydrolase family 10 protein n=1 Tax=Epilithonimonas pallida TaxID=373671 RepID=UPI0024B809B4|nr:family 10 glycosylhydrolase [Epilithonimonas pallida]
MRFRLSFFQILILAAFVVSCATKTKKAVVKKPAAKTEVKTPSPKPFIQPPTITLPEIKREFRGAWIASVANINWPSKNNLSVEQQKQEAIQLLNLLADLNFNAVILQIRPSADALYKSPHEPWSYFLTGQIGTAPYPEYDPLEFWIEESHKRGLEFHAWLNPFRAHHSNGGQITSESMVKKSPDNIVKLKNGMYWFDPADDRTQEQASKVVKDIVSRYDVDGIHFDDYFYPYAEYNGGKDFPDYKSWSVYQQSGGTLSRADWRRANVNKFVKRIYDEIKAQKNDVKFGISPFGIWKPGFPAGIKGSSQYDELYADAKLWLNQGWIDYFTPQLYWPIESSGQSFPLLLQWWSEENIKGRHLWPGLNTVAIKSPNPVAEIAGQIDVSRQILKKDAGAVHWSIAGISKNYSMQQELKANSYKEKALFPETAWLTSKELPELDVTWKKQSNNITVTWNKESEALSYVIYQKYGNNWQTEILSPEIISKNIASESNGKKLSTIVVRSVNKLGKLSNYKVVLIN